VLEEGCRRLSDVADEWFVRNVADMPAWANSAQGHVIVFEPRDVPFSGTGINIRTLSPGQPNARYHAENSQEDFLVLSGECIVIVDDVEYPLRAWDFVHCPVGTRHVFVGAGDGPCHILMIGDRQPEEAFEYPVSDIAARYGGSVREATTDSEAAYADLDNSWTPVNFDWPPA
jgi:uncharacterized cupin superfamily protein